jgi:hypothetical protein
MATKTTTKTSTNRRSTAWSHQRQPAFIDKPLIFGAAKDGEDFGNLFELLPATDGDMAMAEDIDWRIWPGERPSVAHRLQNRTITTLLVSSALAWPSCWPPCCCC